MNLLTERFRFLVSCPRCQRPVHLTPGPMLYATDQGLAAYDVGPLERALSIHLRLGCDRR